MKIDILTLFPNMYNGFLSESIIKRAIESKKVKVNVHNIRDYSKDKHQKVDDTPYGGGSGMVLMCQPIFDAVKDLKNDDTKIILMTPQGVQYNQNIASKLSEDKHIVIICGHYEGFDERIRTLADMEISIGDYVLTGGELPSMVVTDSIVRLVDGVIDDESHQKDSFQDNLLDYPTYTKPQEFEGMKVPDVLLSGHHENIENWRKTESIIRTMERRPDLIKPLTNNFMIIKDNNHKEITYIEYTKLNGFDITPRNDPRRDDILNVTKMILLKPSFIEKVIKKKIDIKMRNLINIFSNLNDDDDNDDKNQMILDELERLKNMIINSYFRHLDVEYRDLILKRILIMINDIRSREREYIDDNIDEIRGKSR